METNQKEVWKKRALKYNNLEWISKEFILDNILLVGEFSAEDNILEVGCGTGKLLFKIAEIVKEAHGLDISKEMLEQVPKKENIILQENKITGMIYNKDYFDQILARMVFHHILTKEEQINSLKRCYQVLKDGGKMIISEGVPPHKCIKNKYTEIFKLKEERITFMPNDIMNLMYEAGFKNIKIYQIIDQDMSLKNWLENDGTLNKEIIDKIMALHRTGSEVFKRLYNLREVNDDILIDCRVAIVVGEK